MRASGSVPLVLISCAVAGVAAGKFDKYTSCESCTAAGFGWSEKKNKCGGFPQKTCKAAASPPKASTPSPPPAPAPFKDSKAVLRLPGEAALEDALIDHNLILLHFYQAGTASTAESAPIFSAAADRLKKRGVDAKLAKIDVDTATVTVGLYGVKSYPSFILFKDGDMESHYDGELSADALVDFVESHADSEEIADEVSLQFCQSRLCIQNVIGFLAFFDCVARCRPRSCGSTFRMHKA